MKTLRSLAMDSGEKWNSTNPSPLTEWYLSARDVPLEQFDIGDLCRAIRQRLFVVELLPFAANLLEEDVLAGDLYDGELVTTLSGLDAELWSEEVRTAHRVLKVLSHMDRVDDQKLSADTSRLKSVLDAICR